MKKTTTFKPPVVTKIGEMRVQLSSEAKRLIASLDRAEERLEELKLEREELLSSIYNEVGATSFLHPSKGPMSIMYKDGYGWFYRPKPSGRKVRARKRTKH